jgi:hypothetical protein
VGAQELADWLSELSFTEPPLPESLVPSLHRIWDGVFSTRVAPLNPYRYSAYVDEALQTTLEDYVVVGHDGHGANSYALSYYVSFAGLRILLQLAWGGAYMDNEAARQRICDVFRELHVLWPTLCAPRDVANLVMVAHSDFYGGSLARNGVVLERWDRQDVSAVLDHFRAQVVS